MAYTIPRIEKRIQYIIGQALLQELKDPRLGMTTVTKVKVTPDYRYGRVYISTYGDEEAKQKALEALNHAKGFLQRFLGKNLRTKRIPELLFIIDDTLEKYEYYESLFQKIRSELEDTQTSEEEIEENSQDSLQNKPEEKNEENNKDNSSGLSD